LHQGYDQLVGNLRNACRCQVFKFLVDIEHNNFFFLAEVCEHAFTRWVQVPQCT